MNTGAAELEKVISKSVFSKALSLLKKGKEIEIVLDSSETYALYYGSGFAQLDHRPAKNHDVRFLISPDAVRVLSAAPDSSLADFGIIVVKEIISGSISVKVTGSLFSVLGGGYISIIKEAGPRFLKYLAENGLKNLSQIPELIKKLKV